ncbi:MAG: retroviral-like aspartic protease family protein, partial [Sphingopyxis sp.]|nr:retroviral-like aspartic protease family protein [Sphingopyxis sp.]
PPIQSASATETLATPLIQPFDIDASRRMSVPVMIGAQGPFAFIVDTGAERTVIARELANRLTLAEGAPLRLATISGPMTAPSYRVAALAMTNLTLAPFEAPALYGNHIGAAGLLGVDMLHGRRVLIDFRKEEMRISASRRSQRPLIRDDDAIVVTARNLAGRLILSDARIDGKRVDVIVDTGAQTSIGNLAMMRLVRKRKQNRFPFVATELTGVSGDTIAAQMTVLRRIDIEGLDVNDLSISFADSHAFRALGLGDRPAMLLGMDALRLFDRIEIDYANKRIILDLPDDAARPGGQRLAAHPLAVPSS